MDNAISRMMTKTVLTVDADDTVEKVEALFNAHKFSSLPVIGADGDVFDIISSRDLLRFHAEKKNSKAIKAWELCTYKPISVGPETPALEVAKLMVKYKIHHVLISENGTLYGIVSALDFVEHYALSAS